MEYLYAVFFSDNQCKINEHLLKEIILSSIEDDLCKDPRLYLSRFIDHSVLIQGVDFGIEQSKTADFSTRYSTSIQQAALVLKLLNSQKIAIHLRHINS